ncbi:hypothetical protein Ade02nite_97040 [Paractinoplanes deccanensis]|uniref:MBL fold metallo-hydrolase n=1 Tax=Paractinoplanes deccanensis TaxID=113561 RepID=A0ABQ3YM43_9ACTN|nr:hypothetical protein [Actinoplanes deccanensis]GID81063.1 hypothetical protein Ade02nite_97040 [Actinoplanes deccanensis]
MTRTTRLSARTAPADRVVPTGRIGCILTTGNLYTVVSGEAWATPSTADVLIGDPGRIDPYMRDA